MNHHQIRALIVLAGSAFFAVCLGYTIAVEQYTLLGLASIGVLGTILFLMPGYVPLLAFGLLTPFTIPLPFIWGFPALLFVLMFCSAKRSLREGLARNRERRINAMALSYSFFFGWIFIRYCMNPVMPNAAGFGANVTGFRPYLNYAICFGLIATLGYFIRSRSDISKMIQWMAWISLFFVLLLIPLMFARSMGVAAILQYLGLYVDVYNNGIFRFVALPSFGLILLSLGLLPDLLPVRPTVRWFLLIMGASAVILGGSRSGLLMATAVVVAVPLLKRNLRKFTMIVVAVGTFFTSAYFVGEKIGSGDAAVLRVLALVSPKVAESTQAGGTWEFREIRWRRAWMEIQNRPLVGRGYGGVENAFVWNNYSNFEDARVEIDIATGGVHNGYIACALTFGIPAALFFIGLLAWTIWRNAKLAMRDNNDVFSKNIHVFVCVNLIAYALTIYIGTDLNNPMLWFWLALGVLMERLKRAESVTWSSKETVAPNLRGTLSTDVAVPARRIV